MVRLFAALALAVTLPATALAQGRVTGTVKDADGHPVKGATITAENANFTASTLTSTTDARGRYSFLGLRGGVWTFTVQAPGFQPQKRQATTRALGPLAPMDYELEPATGALPPGPMANLNTSTLQDQLAKAASLERSGKPDEAIAAYRVILEHVPGLTAVHLQIGAILEAKGDAASAVEEYRAALKGDPANAKARAALDRLARR